MKRRDLLKRLDRAAKTKGVSFTLVREGASHTIYEFGGRHVPVPRHTEINEHTAQGILRNLGA